jgi:hypothetical protein
MLWVKFSCQNELSRFNDMRLTVISFHLFSGEVNVHHDFENSNNVGGGLCTPSRGVTASSREGPVTTAATGSRTEVLVPQNFQEPGFLWWKDRVLASGTEDPATYYSTWSNTFPRLVCIFKIIRFRI